MLCGFPKVGYRKQIFFEKLRVLETKIWEICILRAEILVKNKAEKYKISLKIENEGHMSGTLMVNW